MLLAVRMMVKTVVGDTGSISKQEATGISVIGRLGSRVGLRILDEPTHGGSGQENNA